MTTVRDMVKRGAVMVGRRMSIKRRNEGGEYEATWQDISNYVVSYGTIEKGFGDLEFVGEYQISGTTVILSNHNRYFNDENDASSIFYKYLTRWGTKFKIECFYIDDDDSEIEGLVFYGLLYGDPETSDDGTISLSITSYLKALQNYPATGISTASGTTGEIVTRLLTKTTSGARLFDRYAEGANDAEKYSVNPESKSLTTIPSLTIKETDTVWDVIKRMSLYENFFIYVNNSGNFVWTSRDQTADVIINFNGAGSLDNTDAINIISIDKEVSGLNNVWNKCVVTYGTAKEEAASSAYWAPGDLSTQDKYGERIYEITAPDLDATSAMTVAVAFRNAYQDKKKEWSISTPLIPHLEAKDKCTLSYIGELLTSNPFIVGVSKLGGADLLGLRSGSILVSSATVKLIHESINLDNLSCSFNLREV